MITTQKIFEITCDALKIDIGFAKSKLQKRELVECRQIATYFACKLTLDTLGAIGYIIGGKNHATVLHAKKTVNNLLKCDKTIIEKVRRVNKHIDIFLDSEAIKDPIRKIISNVIDSYKQEIINEVMKQL